MKMVTKIAFANMKYHKSKNILTGVAILLTTLLLFMVPTIGKDMIEGQYAVVNELYANWHALYRSVNGDMVKRLAAHHDIKVYGLRGDAGYMALEDANIALLYLDENGLSLYKMELEEGKLPEKTNEIVVSKGILQELGASGEIGDTVTIPYQTYENGGLGYQQEREFTITGFLPDSDGSRQNRIYNALVSQAFLLEELPEEEVVYRFLFQIDGDKDSTTDEIEEKINNIAAQFGIEENNVAINQEHLSANYVDPDMIKIVVGIMLVVVLAGIITIYSIYYVSMIDSVQEFGKLKAIGTTRRQLKQIVLREGFFIALIAIPIGLIFGTVLVKLVLLAFVSFRTDNLMIQTMKTMIEENAFPIYHWWIYLLAVGVTCVTIYLSLLKPMRTAAKVSEIEAMRYQGSQGSVKKRKKSYKEVSIICLTKINLMGNKKKSLITICSMGITGIFLMVIATVLSCADPAESASNSILGQYLVTANVEEGNKEHPEREWSAIIQDNPLNNELKQQIKAVEGVDKVVCFSSVSLTGGPFEEDGISISGIPEEFAKTIEDSIIEGEASYEDLKSGDKVVLDKIMCYWYPELSVGDVLELTVEDGETAYQKNFEIIAIGDFTPGFANYEGFFMAKDAADALCSNNISRFFHVFAEKDYDENVLNQLKDIINQSELLQIDSWKTQYETWKSALAMTSGACYAFLGILGVICIMNLVNTMIHSMHMRKKEIGMMQAMGMSNLQLVKMLQMEGLFYTLGTLLLSVGVGSALGYPVFLWAKETGMFNISNYHYPVTAAVLVSVLLIVLQMVLAVVLGRSVKKESLIERIRFSE